MATYDDLIKAGLLGPTSQRDAALQGLFALGGQIGRRSRHRLSPTPPPLDLGAATRAYQSSMTGALQRGALSRKLRDEARMRALFGSRPANPQLAQALASQRAVVPAMGLAAGTAERIVARPEMDDPTAFGSDLKSWYEAQKEKAYPAALAAETERLLPAELEATTVSPFLKGFPQQARNFLSSYGKYDPQGAFKLAGEMVKTQLKPLQTPDAIKQYKFAVGQGYPGTFEDWKLLQARSSSPVSYGSPPVGYQYKFDKAGRPVSLVPIAGGPAAAAEIKAKAQEGAGAVTKAQTARLVLDTISDIVALETGTNQPITGTASRPFAAFSNTPAGKLRSLVRNLKSPIALGAIKNLKDSSKSGATGFGALNTAELQLLIDQIGALDPDTTDWSIFKTTINRIGKHYKRVIRDIRKNVSPQRIKELNLGPLLGDLDVVKRWDVEAGKFVEVKPGAGR